MTTIYYVEITDQCDFNRLFSTAICASAKSAQEFIDEQRTIYNQRNGITENTPMRENGFSSATLLYEVRE